MSVPKRDNYRFSFLLELRCEPAQAEAVATDLPGTIMVFTQGNETCWLSMAIDPTSKPVSRLYFRGECKGAKILAKALVILIDETSPSLIDSALKKLASDPLTSGLNPPAVAWLSQNRAGTAIVAAVTSHSDPKDSLLQLLTMDYLKLLAESDPRPHADAFMNSFY